MQDSQGLATLAHGTISAFFSQFRPHFIPFQVRFSHVLQSFVVVSAASSSASDSTPSYIFSPYLFLLSGLVGICSLLEIYSFIIFLAVVVFGHIYLLTLKLVKSFSNRPPEISILL